MLRIQTGDDVRELSREDLLALAAGERDGMACVPFARLAPQRGAATHATFHAVDGYAASIPIEQALADGVVLVPPRDKTGVRLVVTDGGTTCLNVKAVGRIELTIGQGKHTVDPNPHDKAHVPGWDD